LEAFTSLLEDPPESLNRGDLIFQMGIVNELQGRAVEAQRAVTPYYLIWTHNPRFCSSQAKELYERVLQENPNNARIMTQLGWLHHHEGAVYPNPNSTVCGTGNANPTAPGTEFYSIEKAIEYLKRSVLLDPSDPHPWYLLGRLVTLC